MVVDVDGVQYEVRFRHARDARHIWGKGLTQCEIWWNPDDETEDGIFAYAYCSKKDTFIKARGRKVALTKAIQCFPKDTRRVFWETYFSRHCS